MSRGHKGTVQVKDLKDGQTGTIVDSAFTLDEADRKLYLNSWSWVCFNPSVKRRLKIRKTDGLIYLEDNLSIRPTKAIHKGVLVEPVSSIKLTVASIVKDLEIGEEGKIIQRLSHYAHPFPDGVYTSMVTGEGGTIIRRLEDKEIQSVKKQRAYLIEGTFFAEPCIYYLGPDCSYVYDASRAWKDAGFD